jgi:hypothetical protein
MEMNLHVTQKGREFCASRATVRLLKRLLHGIIYLANKIINIPVNIGLLLNIVHLSSVFIWDIVNLDVML